MWVFFFFFLHILMLKIGPIFVVSVLEKNFFPPIYSWPYEISRCRPHPTPGDHALNKLAFTLYLRTLPHKLQLFLEVYACLTLKRRDFFFYINTNKSVFNNSKYPESLFGRGWSCIFWNLNSLYQWILWAKFNCVQIIYLDRLHNPAAANTYVNGISDDMIIVGCFAWQNTQNVTIDKILIYCSSHRVHFPFSCLWAKMRPILYIYKHQGKWGVSTIVSSNMCSGHLFLISPLNYHCLNIHVSINI